MRTDNLAVKKQLILEQIRKLELQNQRAAGQLLNANEVENLWNRIISGLRTKLLGFPSALAPALSACKDFAEIKDVLDAAILGVLTELSEFDPDTFVSQVYVDVAAPTSTQKVHKHREIKAKTAKNPEL